MSFSDEEIRSVHSDDGSESDEESPDRPTVVHPSFEESVINSLTIGH